jgi:tetratricopeptide (TPR) repeat protein
MGRVRDAGAVCIVLALLCACSNKKDDSNRLVNQALEKASQNDLSAAKSKLQLAIAADPSNAAAYHTRAAILCKEGAIDEAIPDFEKAVEISKDNPAWRYELAGKYWELYQASAETSDRDQYPPKVEEQVSRAIELNPNLAEYFLLRARARKAMMLFKGAAQDYRKAIDLDPLEVGSYLELGRLYSLMWKVFYRDDLFGLAEQTLATAEKLGELPDLSTEGQALLPDMLFELAQLYAWRGQVETDTAAQKGFREKAIASYVSIEDEYRDRSMLKLQLAQVFQQNGDIPKACTAAREAMQGISGSDPGRATLRNYVVNLEQEVCVTSTGYDPNR